MEGVVFFKEFNVVKFLERGALEVWNKLKVGEQVSLEKDEKDPNIILVKLDNLPCGELPEQECKIIRDFFKQGWGGVFKAWICKRNEEALYDQRISIAVYIISNSNSEKVTEQKTGQ